MSMNILVTGAKGNLGRILVTLLSAQGHPVTGIDIDELDITNFEQVVRYIDSVRPQVVIHCAAMTNVDRCATEPELANRINGYGAQNVALACERVGAAMCHISSNEVFDGQKGSPYLEYDVTHPINPYGYSKWLAEHMVRDVLPHHYIVRISWLFAQGGSNFLQKIVSTARQGQSLAVVIDEIANPTYAVDVAEALSRLILTQRYGIYHLTNSGATSRYDFARHILDSYGLVDVPIARIVKAQFNRPSRPPTYAALANFNAAQLGITLRPWQAAVIAFVAAEQQAKSG